MQALAAYLKNLLTRRSWSLRDAESHLGVSRNTLNLIQSGNTTPELETLDKLSQGTGLALGQLIEMAGYNLGLRPADRFSPLLNNPAVLTMLEALLVEAPERAAWAVTTVQYLLKNPPPDE